ncbi:hypothetical protein JX265_006933 [Neoarthrinium moseri]|uniref:Uncharacterized protein n=1 Tax=Neoarthrinium moseri TaxID=1658444 RepID=A0A9P9WL28_9PEZI|nr:hypothetical protein JX266_012974 [Neoarthrinium moseri]KAI1868954.1 hypothetical protein JX265_006933 [Neoarthrinium moseri]
MGSLRYQIGCIFDEFDMFDGTRSSADHLQAVRFLTFEFLGLTHTCCNDKWDIYHQDEVEQDEESMIELFEGLVEEFMTQVRAVPAGASYVGFWRSCFFVRIDEVLEILNGSDICEKQRRGAEALGVVWKTGPEIKPACEDTVDKKDTWEYWSRKLEEIE